MFGRSKKEPKEIIIVEETIILIDGEKWFRHDHKHKGANPVRMIHTTTFNNFKIQIMAFDPIAANQKAPIQVALQDAVTLQPAQDAVASNVVHVVDNTAAATIDADNNLVGVAEGAGNVTSDADWSYTDSQGNPQTTHKQVVTPFTVTAVVTPADGVQMVVTLGSPVSQ